MDIEHESRKALSRVERVSKSLRRNCRGKLRVVCRYEKKRGERKKFTIKLERCRAVCPTISSVAKRKQ